MSCENHEEKIAERDRTITVLQERNSFQESVISFVRRAFQIGDRELRAQRNTIKTALKDVESAQYPINFTEAIKALENNEVPNSQKQNIDFLRLILNVLLELHRKDTALSFMALLDFLWKGTNEKRSYLVSGYHWDGLRETGHAFTYRDCKSALQSLRKAKVLICPKLSLRSNPLYICDSNHRFLQGISQ